jgi:UDP-glucose 4-epimerase
MLNGPLLVTGANGFIGATIARTWRAADRDVVGFVRPNALGNRSDSGMRLHVAPLTVDAVAETMARFQPSAIFHAAGSASVEASLRRPVEDFADSVGTFHAVLEATRRSGYRPRIIFPSSAAVYGEPETLPIPETAPIRPISPYGHHKAMAELLAREYALCFDVPVLIVRLFSVFGAHQKRLLVRELFEQFQRENVVTIQGTGNETRDFLHEDDVGAAVLAMLPRITETHAVVNVATGHATRVRDIAEMMRGLLGSSKDIRCENRERPGNPLMWAADTRKLKDIAPALTLGSADDLEGRLRETIVAWRRSESVHQFDD